MEERFLPQVHSSNAIKFFSQSIRFRKPSFQIQKIVYRLETSDMISINHPLISRITCLRKKQWYRYGNVLPFLPAYIVALASFWKVETIGACIILGIVAFFHILSFFMCIWSLRYRIHTRYEKVSYGIVK